MPELSTCQVTGTYCTVIHRSPLSVDFFYCEADTFLLYIYFRARGIVPGTRPTSHIGACMIEKPESEDFDGEEDDTAAEADDPALDHLLDSFDKRKKGAPKAGEPAWRRLERRREERETAAQVSDLDDYEIDEPGAERRRRR